MTVKKIGYWNIALTSRHRRKQRHLIIRRDRMIHADIFEIDRDLHHAAVGERGLVGGAQGLQPVEELADGVDAWRRRELFARFAELAAKPGEIKQLHQPTSPKG